MYEKSTSDKRKSLTLTFKARWDASECPPPTFVYINLIHLDCLVF